MIKIITYSLLAFMLAGSNAAFAMAKKHKHKMFERLDVNSDGAITKTEFLTGLEKKFDRMDSNDDGKVTKAEAKEYHKKKKHNYKDNH